MELWSRRHFLLGGLSGCAWCLAGASTDTRIPPASMQPLIAPGYQPSDPDERGLWHACDRLEADLAASNLLVRDPVLHGYLTGVTHRLVGEGAVDLRLYIVRNPDFNASMAPNGVMIVHTGLMARVHNEAQLGAVIGHEAGHYLRQHSLQGWRDRRAKSAVAAVIGIAGAAATGATGSNWYDMANAINSALLFSLFSFSRHQESEADAYGVKLLNEAGYPPGAAAEVWAQLIEERKASAAARKARYRDHARSAFSTHPPSTERMSDLTASAAEFTRIDYDERKQPWLTAIAPFRATLLEEQIKLNDSGASLYLVNRLAQDGWSGPLRFYEGEVFRLRGEAGDEARAADAYAAAVSFPDAPPEAYRAHGYAQLKAGNIEAGKHALTRYLELAPDAVDAAMIRFSLSQ